MVRLGTLLRQIQRDVRVRFAPSPTGQLHLGGLRTALYNYLYAKAHGGKFVLRVEDTDQSRLVPGSIESMYRVLHHYRLHPDEGPENGGPYGPYKQSQRLDLYNNWIERLLESNNAYRCFCSEERLELLRKDAIRNNRIPKYDGKCRHIHHEEANNRTKNGEPHVIRFKLDKQDVSFVDQVYGPVTQTLDESDFVLIKSDGYPTYHFANVIDDHLMEISHVIRGMEWLSSAGKHCVIYKSLGLDIPRFIHLPLITRDGKKKLSKRDKDAFTDYYHIEKGYLPQAILNYLLRNGSGISDFDPEKMYSLENMVENFDATTIGRRNLQMDQVSLEHYGRLSFQSTSFDDLYPLVVERVSRDLPGSEELLKNKEYLRKIVDFLKNNEESFCALNELTDKFQFFFTRPTGPEKLRDAFAENIEQVIDVLRFIYESNTPWSTEFFNMAAKKCNVPKVLIFKILRLTLVDSTRGPPIMEIYSFFEHEECISRIGKVLSQIEIGVQRVNA